MNALISTPSLKAKNRCAAIERRVAFMKDSLGLDLVNTRTAESLTVKIDAAIVLCSALSIFLTLRASKITNEITNIWNQSAPHRNFAPEPFLHLWGL